MQHKQGCQHPGCDRPATQLGEAPSDWEDASSRSVLMLCYEHGAVYERRISAGEPPFRAISGQVRG